MLAAPGGSAGGTRERRGRGRRRAGPRGRACLGPAARSCVQYVCLCGRPRASVRRGPRGPAQLRDCRSRSAPARLVPAGSCARPLTSMAATAAAAAASASRRRSRPPGGDAGARGAARREGAALGRGVLRRARPLQASARAPPGCEEWAGGSGAGRVTSRQPRPPGAQACAEPRDLTSWGPVAGPAPHPPHTGTQIRIVIARDVIADGQVRPGAPDGPGLGQAWLEGRGRTTRPLTPPHGSGCPSGRPEGAIRQECFLE